MAATYDFTIEQGSAFRRVLTYRDENGALVDLTGYSARMQIRATTEGSLLVELTTANGRIALGGAGGTITLAIDAVTTAALTRGGVYDLELLPGGDEEQAFRLVQGAVSLSREVTRD